MTSDTYVVWVSPNFNKRKYVMKKVDINVTEATMASLSIVVGDVIADKNDDKYNILYIDYTGESVVCGFDNTALILSFDVIAGGEYQQVVGD